MMKLKKFKKNLSEKFGRNVSIDSSQKVYIKAGVKIIFQYLVFNPHRLLISIIYHSLFYISSY